MGSQTYSDRQQQSDLRAARHGDRAAFARLYDHLFPRVYGYIAGRTPTRQDAEDLTGDVWLRAVRGLAGFNGQDAVAFTAWIFRIARRRIADFYRRARPVDSARPADLDRQAAARPTPPQIVELAEHSARIRAAVRRLSPRRQKVIALRYFAGLRNQEIARDGAKPNYDEVPGHLRQPVEEQFAGPVIEPTPGPDQAIRIEIPALEIDAPVVQGDGWDQLKKGVGQHLGTANPGQPGNVVLAAHNDIYGEIFRHLDRLAPGDEVILHTEAQSFTYRVTGWQIVAPTDVGVMDQTADPVLTLISCYPYLVNSQRIVVTAAWQPLPEYPIGG